MKAINLKTTNKINPGIPKKPTITVLNKLIGTITLSGTAITLYKYKINGASKKPLKKTKTFFI